MQSIRSEPPSDTVPREDEGVDQDTYGRFFAPGSKSDLQFRVSRRLSAVARRWRMALDARLRRSGHTRTQWEVLFSLTMLGGSATLTSIADRMGVEAPSVVALLNRLDEDGLIVRRTDVADRRARTVSLTDAGKMAVETMHHYAIDLREGLMEGLTVTELETLMDLLSRMRINLQREGFSRG